MSATESSAPSAPTETLNAEECAGKSLRADAKRNRDKVLAAAREAFTENGASTSLEAIARRAGVGIGTLYRHSMRTSPASYMSAAGTMDSYPRVVESLCLAVCLP
jgi:hypothetical protein